VRCDRLGIFERSACLKICGNAGCPERVAADLAALSQRWRAAPYHPKHIDAVHRFASEFARLAARGAE
jgi:hypothetical protein